jgi:cytochrome bd-type quinol oxidase subunit 2
MKDLVKTSWATATSFFSKKALIGLLLLGVFLGGTVVAQGVLAAKDNDLTYPNQNVKNMEKPEESAPNAYATPNNGYTLQTIVKILGQVRDFVLIIGIIFIVIMIVWAGIQYVTAGGDEEKQEDAKQKVVGALIGAAIILAAFALIATIRNLVENRSLT